MKTTVFTLCSNNYLAQAKTLGDSIRLHHPEYQYVIGLVDRKHPDIDYGFFEPYQILPYDEIGFEIFDEMIERYNIVEFNTAVKPFYFEYLAHQMDECDSILYIDPDILFHKPIKEVEEALIEYEFVLTPHKVNASLDQGQFEKLIHNVGTYNLGFLALKITEQTRFFMKWWQERLKYDCRISYNDGLFVDQIWANFIPSMFEKVYILRHPGYNVGYWNFDERSLTENGASFQVNRNYPLILFHYSTYNPNEPFVLGKFLDYSFEEREDLHDLYTAYRDLLVRNKYNVFSKLPRGLDFIQNHPFVDKESKSEEKVLEASEPLSLRNKIGIALRHNINKVIRIIFNV